MEVQRYCANLENMKSILKFQCLQSSRCPRPHAPRRPRRPRSCWWSPAATATRTSRAAPTATWSGGTTPPTTSSSGRSKNKPWQLIYVLNGSVLKILLRGLNQTEFLLYHPLILGLTYVSWDITSGVRWFDVLPIFYSILEYTFCKWIHASRELVIP